MIICDKCGNSHTDISKCVIVVETNCNSRGRETAYKDRRDLCPPCIKQLATAIKQLVEERPAKFKEMQ